MLLNLVRVLFLLLSTLLGGVVGHYAEASFLMGGAIGMALGFVVLGLEIGVARNYPSYVPTVVLGLAVGFISAQLLEPVILRLPWVTELDLDRRAPGLVSFFLIFLFSYLATAVILQTKDEFKFSIPYVQFRREGRGSRPMIVDTSALIDGRFQVVAESRMLDAPIVIARPVLVELQAIADSADPLKRNRGRRGLEGLQRLQANPHLDIRLDESPRVGETVDLHLVGLAKRLDGRLVTTDFNLHKVAQVEGVDVVNLNALATLLKPTILAGEPFEIRLIRPGEEPGQGVGYLEDGTMVVVEGGRPKVGQTISAVATNTLQTQAGRLVFAKPA